MEFTPENVINLPAGKYTMYRSPYIAIPEHVEENELHVWWDNEGYKRYFVGNFLNRFALSIERNEDGKLVFSAFATVANNLLEMSEHTLWELKKYKIKI